MGIRAESAKSAPIGNRAKRRKVKKQSFWCFLTFRRNHPVLMGAPTETCAHQEGVISAGRSENSHSGGYLRPVATRLGRWPSWRFWSPSCRWAKELLTKGGSMGHTVNAVDSYVVRGKPGAPAPPGAALCAKSGRGDMGGDPPLRDPQPGEKF